MVGTKWIGFPAVGAGSVARSVDGGSSFRAATTAYTPLTLSGLACPTRDSCVAAGGKTLARISLEPAPAR